MEHIVNEDILGIVVAMTIEAEPLIEYYKLEKNNIKGFSYYVNHKIKIIISGVGVINSTLATYILLNDLNCTHIINYGVAGFTGDVHHHCEIFTINKVYKRDINFTALGYELYQFPDKPKYIQLQTDNRLPMLDCYTSDEYIGPKSRVPNNVLVDMEGYCVAHICERYQTSCMIYKSISDNTPDHDTQGQIDAHLTNAIEMISNFIIHEVIERGVTF